MLDRDELTPQFEWLRGSKYYDQALGEAALAIELCAAGAADRADDPRADVTADANTVTDREQPNR